VTALLAIVAQSQNQQGGGLLSILILVLPLAALVYLMIVPQRKQRARQQEFLSSLEVGDEVVTAGGIYGTINHIEDGVAHLEVDTDVVIKVALTSLARPADEPAESTPAGRNEAVSEDSKSPKTQKKGR
jgi:preprotein translocase subunit YajC